MLIINDVHLGVQRKAGTTPASQETLRTYLFDSLERCLEESTEDHLLVLGDLFDTFEVSPRDWIQAYHIFARWILRAKRLTLVAGNHDHSPKALKVSAFQMLCDVLVHGYGEEVVKVVGIDQYAEVAPGVVALAHCSNQDIFDLKLKEILAREFPPQHLLLHANFDNNFAAQADHSLNVSREQAQAFITAGTTLVFAHEHQARREMDGKVIVLGNQWPTSIADCLHNDRKLYHTLKDGALDHFESWVAAHSFAEVDWRELGSADPTLQFIRVAGDASSNEAGEVISLIAKFRSRSTAFVVSNAVKIDGIAQAEELPETFEATKNFDVMTFIKDSVTAEEFTVVTTKLIKDAR